MRVLVVPRPDQPWLLSVLLTLAIFVSLKWLWSQPVKCTWQKGSHTSVTSTRSSCQRLVSVTCPSLPPQTVGHVKSHSQIQCQKSEMRGMLLYLEARKDVPGLWTSPWLWGAEVAHMHTESEDSEGKRTRSNLSLKTRTSIPSIQELWDNPLNHVL